MKPQELSINGELFEEFRNNLDVALKILINRMIVTRIGKGAVSAKILINMKEFIDEGGEVVRMPEMDFSIGMGMSETDKRKGNLHRGLILKRRPTGGLLIGTDQISIDEYLEERKA